jgi:hypothetical protein
VLPNTIIAGTNKSGTTSLFRYLADHPSVCSSKIKEVRYFSRFNNPSFEDAHEYYNDQFPEYTDQQIRLEASPDYLLHGLPTAEGLFTIIPDTKLIFVLREPISRLISAFNRQKSREHPALSNLNLSNYLDLVFSKDKSKAQQLPIDLQWLDYSDRLGDFLRFFPAENIAVRFFQHLSDDSSAFIMELCDFLKIDPNYYHSYNFGIENRTRGVKFPSVHRVAHGLNLRFEPVFNRHSGLRTFARKLYSTINYTSSPQNIDIDTDKYFSEELYIQEKQSLATLMSDTFPSILQPIWLR